MLSKLDKHYTLFLYTGFCILLASFVFLAFVYFKSIISINDELEYETNNNGAQLREALTMRVSIRERALLLWQMSLFDDPFERDDLFQKFSIYGNNYLVAREKLGQTALSALDRKYLFEVDRGVRNREITLREIAVSLMDFTLELKQLDETKFKKIMNEQSYIADSLDELIRSQEKQNQKARRLAAQETENIISELNNWLIVFIVTVLLFARVIANNANKQRNILHALNTKLKSLARHDALTGLPNRLYLLEHMERTLSLANRRKKTGALLFIDLDDFKPINDTYGHDTGDIFLKTISREMQSHLRDSDLLARLGGDEFVVILFEISSDEDAIVVANKLLSTLSTPYVIDNLRLQASASIGICTFPRENKNVSQLLSCADEAMYRVKESGKSNYYICGMDDDQSDK